MGHIRKRRLGVRENVHLRATVTNRSGSRTEVVVVNMSASGARLELPFAAEIDPKHLLVFEDDVPERHCELVWRDGYEAGVRFLLAGEEGDLHHHRYRMSDAANKTPLTALRAIAKQQR